MDLNEMLVFARFVQAGSFTTAAAELGMPKSTVSRKVSELEERLGSRLLQRTGEELRRLRLFTPSSATCCAAELREPDQGKRRDQRSRVHPLSTPYCEALVTATGSPRAGVRLLSMLKAPAPLPKTINSPPQMARFLRKLTISICCCSAGTAQKLWNTI